MTSKLTSLLTAAALVGGLALAPAVFAQGTSPSPTAPSTQGGQGMINGQGMMNGQGGMANMMPMMSQMNRMMDNCNRMMESANTNGAPSGGTAAPPSNKG